mmetsp:Transcript_10273/g.15539  ORF Transcript_10273/g.15539 Transcript_10273/m.15539 type:complete len:243 (+) Transcript_10273:49-777(+)
MWPAFPPKEASNAISNTAATTTTSIIKHIHEYLPPQTSAIEHTAIKAVSVSTAALFVKIWMTASMEGMLLQRPPEDVTAMNGLHASGGGVQHSREEQKLLDDIGSSLQQRIGATQLQNQNAGDRTSATLSQTPTQQKLKEKRLLYSSGYRYSRMVSNDLENIPITLLLAWGNLYANTNHKITTICISIFTFCRFIHAYCYMNALQPYRTISHLCGLLSTFVMAFNLLYAVFQFNKSKPSASI